MSTTYEQVEIACRKCGPGKYSIKVTRTEVINAEYSVIGLVKVGGFPWQADFGDQRREEIEEVPTEKFWCELCGAESEDITDIACPADEWEPTDAQLTSDRVAGGSQDDRAAMKLLK